jgi:hypothetical protein
LISIERIRYIWCFLEKWKYDQIRQVRNIHLIGKCIRRRLNRKWTLKNQVITIPECTNFEKVSNWCEEKIDKAICYLRWKKDKFKLQKKNIENTLIEEAFDSSAKYGFQVKFNSFLIWKFTVRWNLYAIINLISCKVTFGYSRSKWKRRRLEVLYNLLYSLLLKNGFESNEMMLINQDSLKTILRYMKKKKRRLKIELIYEKEIVQTIKIEISRNWKSRKKKPPDKIVKMNFRIINEKEYNVLRRNLKIFKENVRRSVICARRRWSELTKIVSMNTNRDEKNNNFEVSYITERKFEGLQQYVNIVGSIDHFDDLIKSEIDTLSQGRVSSLFWKCTESEAG